MIVNMMFNKQECILTETLYLLKRHNAQKLRIIIQIRAVTSGRFASEI